MRNRKLIIAVSAVAFMILSAVSYLISRNLGMARLATGVPSEPYVRSVKLHNYNNWGPPRSTDPDYNAKIQWLAACDRICMTESYQQQCQVSTTDLRRMNPSAQIFRIYALSGKSSWDTDWNNPSNLSRMQTPVTRQMIEVNDWWMRDGNGNIVRESDTTVYLDVGKPGFKEAYLSTMLERLSGLGFDGVVLDYWSPHMVGWWFANRKLPPPVDYPNDDVWFANAWQPFISYVVEGLHDAGYRVIGNCAGEYGTLDPLRAWQRSIVDGTICEEGAVSYSTSGGNWLPGNSIEQRIAALANDPLDLWFGNQGLQPGIVDLERKITVSMAMYYVGIPASQEKRTYNYKYDGDVHWCPLWDFRIGVPSGPIEQPYRTDSATSLTTRRYFWARRYTGGYVLLNYNNGPAGIRYQLPGKYVTLDGQYLAGRISVEPHSALILQSVSYRTQGGRYFR